MVPLPRSSERAEGSDRQGCSREQDTTGAGIKPRAEIPQQGTSSTPRRSTDGFGGNVAGAKRRRSSASVSESASMNFMSGSDRRIAEKSGQPRVAPFSAQNGFTNPFDRSYRTHPIAIRIKREPVIRQITRHRYERVTHDRAERGDIAIALAVMILDRSLDQPVAIIGARVPYLAGHLDVPQPGGSK
jgi:hypothetical protein